LEHRIAEGVAGEIAGAHGQRRHQTGKGDAVALIFLFAIDEEKGLVLRMGPPTAPPNWFRLNFWEVAK
jgi:hypothetical protein